MKKSLQSISFLLIGVLIFSSCSNEKTEKSLEQTAEKTEIPSEEIADPIPSDLTTTEESGEQASSVNPIPPIPAPVPESNTTSKSFIDDAVVDFPAVDPMFTGGEKAMMKFISDNVNYPILDRQLENEGKVYVSFIVEKDGSLSGIKVLRGGVTESLNREAVRVIRSMPKWKPGEMGNKEVRCRVRLPIEFKLK